MNRRDLIRGIGVSICAGVAPKFVPSLIGGGSSPRLRLPQASLDWLEGQLLANEIDQMLRSREDMLSSFASAGVPDEVYGQSVVNFIYERKV